MTFIKRLFLERNPLPRMRMEISDYGAIYALGDVHGCLRELISAQKKIALDAQRFEKKKLLVLIGDYVDRGPNSKAVLDSLVKPPMDGFDRVALRGNHDDTFLRFVQNPRSHLDWLQLGGMETLRSYDIDADHLLGTRAGIDALVRQVEKTIPPHHLTFLQSLPVVLDMGSLVFVHAGIAPGVGIGDQRDYDLMWIREPFLEHGPKLPVKVIHGHTVSEEPFVGNGRIGIDTGCYATGNLTILRIVGDEMSFL